jgi:hypothetical protein
MALTDCLARSRKISTRSNFWNLSSSSIKSKNIIVIAYFLSKCFGKSFINIKNYFGARKNIPRPWSKRFRVSVLTIHSAVTYFQLLQLVDILICLKNIERCTAAAHDGYRLLLDKFPRSVPLLYSFASFYDVVLNRLVRVRSLFG